MASLIHISLLEMEDFPVYAVCEPGKGDKDVYVKQSTLERWNVAIAVYGEVQSEMSRAYEGKE